MMSCQNCGSEDGVVVSVECNVPLVNGRAGPPYWSVSVACAACASTHVT